MSYRPSDKELDFSHYMDKPHGKPAPAVTEEEPSPLRRRPIILLALAIVLAGVLWYMLDNASSGGDIVAPPGYRIIESPTEPPRLEKLK
jgi:hypothetical protein